MQNIRPKLGNASTLFASDEPKGLNAFAPKDPKSRSWIGRIAGVAALVCLAVSVLLFQQNNNIVVREKLGAIPETTDDTIAVVHAENDSGELIGTLVRMESEEDEAPRSMEKPMMLTEQERQRLLDIISNQ